MGVRRLYANITRIFDKKARDEQKIVSAVHALEKAEKVVMRKKVTAKRLSEANAVGAICFRQDTADADIEILLVRTSSRDRWIFPKGTITPGSDHLATLGRELEEEAGVVGDVNAGEPIFLTYRKGDGTQKNLVLYPVRVISFGPPKEAGRLPTWISASKVLKKLKEGRERDDSFDALATAFNFFVATRK